MQKDQIQIQVYVKKDTNLFARNDFQSKSFIKKMRQFRTHKDYSQDLIVYLTKIIQEDSILTLKKLSDFFNQVNNVITNSLQKNQINIQSNYRYLLGSLYLSVTYKLDLLRQYYGYSQTKGRYESLFKEHLLFLKQYQKLFVLSGSTIQVLHISKQKSSESLSQKCMTAKDSLMIYYYKKKVEKLTKINYIYQQNSLQIMQFVSIYKPFSPQYQYKQFFDTLQFIYDESQSQFKVIQNPINKILSLHPGMAGCVTCAQFFYFNFEIKGQNINLCDIIAIEQIQHLKFSLKNSAIKIKILALINSDSPSVMLFNCIPQGLNIIVKGQYLTQSQKTIYEQKFIQLANSIKPAIRINQDYKIQYVPVKQSVLKSLDPNVEPSFLKGTFVMRVKFHPKRPWILHCCEIDTQSYFYKRENGKNVELKGEQFYLQMRRRYRKYSPYYPVYRQIQKQTDPKKLIQLLQLINGKREIPASFHSHLCKNPLVGDSSFTKANTRYPYQNASY